MTQSTTHRASRFATHATRVGLLLLLAVTVTTSGCGLKRRLAAARTNQSMPDPAEEEWLKRSVHAKKTPTLTLAYAELVEDQGNLGEARLQYEAILAADLEADNAPSANDRLRARLGLARIAGAEGDDPAALGLFSAVLKDHPNEAAALQSFGTYQLSKQRLPEAESLLRRAVAAAPSDRGAKLSLAETLLRQRHFDESRRLFVSAHGAKVGRHVYARRLAAVGQRSMAMNELQAVLQLDPSNAAAASELTQLSQSVATRRVRPVQHRQSPAVPQRVQQARY